MMGLALLVSLSNTAVAAAYDSFPMDSGNFWIFDAPEGHRTIAVDHTDALGGGWFASDTAGLLSEPVTVYDHTSSDELVVDDAALFDFAAADGDSWRFALSACDTYDVTAATDSAGGTTTPAGRFTGLSGFVLDHVPSRSDCDDAPLSAIKFAQDIGPVSFTDAAGARGRLLLAFVGGAIVAASSHDTASAGGLSVTLVVNDAEVASGAATAVAILRNASDDTIDLTRSGFIIDIFDRVDGTTLGSTTLGEGAAVQLPAGGVQVLSTTLDLAGLTGDLTVRAAPMSGTGSVTVDISR